MGKIDKEKLIEDLPCSDGNGCRGTKCKHNVAGENLTQCINKVIKSFPEETVKKAEIPVKTIYTLKKEYQDVFKDFSFLHSTFDTHSYEPPPENIKKYCDCIEEIDYSAIPKGSIVEVRIKGVGNHFCKFHSINDADGSINLHCVGESDCTFKLNKDDFIRVVEWGKEV